MADETTNGSSPSETPFVWQSLGRLCTRLGLRQKEVLDEVGRGIERLRIGGNTLFRAVEGATFEPRSLSDEERADMLEEAPQELDERWESVLHEYRSGLRKRPNGLRPRAPKEVRESQEVAANEEVEEATPVQTLQPWSRFPGWFGPLFEPDEVTAS